MRALIPFLILTAVAATPVAAQTAGDSARLGALEAQQQMDRQRAVAQQNELSTLDAQLRTERAAASIERQTAAPRVPVIEPAASATSRAPAAPVLAGIPDDRLAASQAAVRKASKNRR